MGASPTGPLAIYTNTNKYTTDELKQKYNDEQIKEGHPENVISDPNTTVNGITFKDDVGLTYVASDVARNAKLIFVIAVRIHEIGNSINNQTGHRLHIDTTKHPLVLYHDKDAGMALEDCVFGGQVLPNGMVTIAPAK